MSGNIKRIISLSAVFTTYCKFIAANSTLLVGRRIIRVGFDCFHCVRFLIVDAIIFANQINATKT